MNKEEAIIQILRREYEKKRYGRLWTAFGKARGNLTSRLTVPTPDNEEYCILTTQGEVEALAAETLAGRFKEGHSSPFCSGKLLDSVWYLGNGPAVQQILEGTYEFPDDCPLASRQLCVEASKLIEKTAKDLVSTFVRPEEFQQWWLTANVNVS